MIAAADLKTESKITCGSRPLERPVSGGARRDHAVRAIPAVLGGMKAGPTCYPVVQIPCRDSKHGRGRACVLAVIHRTGDRPTMQTNSALPPPSPSMDAGATSQSAGILHRPQTPRGSRQPGGQAALSGVKSHDGAQRDIISFTFQTRAEPQQPGSPARPRRPRPGPAGHRMLAITEPRKPEPELDHWRSKVRPGPVQPDARQARPATAAIPRAPPPPPPQNPGPGVLGRTRGTGRAPSEPPSTARERAAYPAGTDWAFQKRTALEAASAPNGVSAGEANGARLLAGRGKSAPEKGSAREG